MFVCLRKYIGANSNNECFSKNDVNWSKNAKFQRAGIRWNTVEYGRSLDGRFRWRTRKTRCGRHDGHWTMNVSLRPSKVKTHYVRSEISKSNLKCWNSEYWNLIVNEISWFVLFNMLLKLITEQLCVYCFDCVMKIANSNSHVKIFLFFLYKLIAYNAFRLCEFHALSARFR